MAVEVHLRLTFIYLTFLRIVPSTLHECLALLDLAGFTGQALEGGGGGWGAGDSSLRESSPWAWAKKNSSYLSHTENPT